MTQEERKAAISAYQKENNRKVLKAMKIPGVLTLLGVLYIYLADYVFDFQSKWATLPGILLFLIGLISLKDVLNDWGKIPEFEDDPVLDSSYDKLITFFSGFFLLVPFFALMILTIWTQNFYSQWWFWGSSIVFGILFSTSLYNILKHKVAGFEQHNKQRLEELGRLWILFLLVGILIFQGLLLSFTYFQNGEVMVMQQKQDEIKYKGNWVSARRSKAEYVMIKDQDSVKVEVVPVLFGIKYFRNFNTIK
ncbi:MAG: hypothetical protein IPL08_09415 [Saprospiraceae bacterium]|nr:hypothetical protein [Saprospiraceae bacterium]